MIFQGDHINYFIHFYTPYNTFFCFILILNNEKIYVIVK